MTVYLYTGTSGGKTTNAIGAAIRTLAHGKNVLFVQFLKYYKNTGEYIFQGMWNRYGQYETHDACEVGIRLNFPTYEIKQFGKDGWKGIKNLNEEDRKLCIEGVNYIYEKIKSSHIDLLVLDEVNFAAFTNMLTIEEIQQLINQCRSQNITVFMTGRCPDREKLNQLLALCDIGNEIRCIKSPPTMVNDEGIQW